MKKYKVKFIIILIITMILMVISSNFSNAYSFKFEAIADKSSIAQGDTVTITFSVNDIDAGEYGINTLDAMFHYDKNVFEKVETKSFKSINNWTINYNDDYREDEGKILGLIMVAGVKENQDICKVTLKVKNNTNINETKIIIKDIETNNGKDVISEVNKEINFKIG